MSKIKTVWELTLEYLNILTKLRKVLGEYICINDKNDDLCNIFFTSNINKKKLFYQIFYSNINTSV
jgi:hypothetical protein